MEDRFVWLVLVVLFVAAFFCGGYYWKMTRSFISRQAQALWKENVPRALQEYMSQQVGSAGKNSSSLGTLEAAIFQQFQSELATLNQRLAALEQKHGGLPPMAADILRDAAQAATRTAVATGPELALRTVMEPEPNPAPSLTPTLSDPEQDRFLARLDNLKTYLEAKGERGRQLYQDLWEGGFGANTADKVDFINRFFEVAGVGELRDQSLKFKCEQLFDLEVKYPSLGDSIDPRLNDSITSINWKDMKQVDIYTKIQEYWQNKEIGPSRVCYVVRPIVKERQGLVTLQHGEVVLYY